LGHEDPDIIVGSSQDEAKISKGVNDHNFSKLGNDQPK